MLVPRGLAKVFGWDRMDIKLSPPSLIGGIMNSLFISYLPWNWKRSLSIGTRGLLEFEMPTGFEF